LRPEGAGRWDRQVGVQIHRGVRDIVIALMAQVVWVVTLAVSGAMLVFLFGTTNLHKALDSRVSVPAWAILCTALLVMVSGLVILVMTRRASVVRGRAGATRANLALLRSRARVSPHERVIRGTRFGRWPQSEVLEQRSAFRHELDTAILKEGASVRCEG
jgi:hypothetical protein